MARLFDDGSSEYLEVNSAPVTAVPLTLACWFYSDDATISQNLVVLQDTGVQDNWFRLIASGTAAGDPVQARTKQAGGTAATSQSSSGYTANTWHHACGVFTAVDSRAAFIDGGSKGTDSNTQTPAGIDRVSIAALRHNDPEVGLPMSGRIAEVGIWNVALSDAEVAMLATGIRPIYVRPQSIVQYLPLWRDEDEDYVGGLSFTAANTPSVASHPPVFSAPPLLWAFEAAGAVVHNLVVQDGSHTHSGDSPHLSQAQFLTVADGQHTQTADSPHLSQDQFLIIADGSHTHTADNVILTGGFLLVIQDGSHTHTADSPHLSQDQFIIVQDGEHKHIADGIRLVGEDVLLVRPRANWPFWS